MFLVGKFELNEIDAQNGVVVSRYPAIDKGSLLKKMKGKENYFWIVSDFYGKYFQFYKQENNDLIFYEKVELNDYDIYRGHNLVKINDEIFAPTNHYGLIFVYQIVQNS